MYKLQHYIFSKKSYNTISFFLLLFFKKEYILVLFLPKKIENKIEKACLI